MFLCIISAGGYLCYISPVLFDSRALCAFLNVISDVSDCGPDAPTFPLFVSRRMCPAG